MADSWEDWDADDDTLIAGLNIDVDESKFANEDVGSAATWEDSVPQSQPKKAAAESKYAAKDREYASKVAPRGFAGDSKAAQQAAQEEADILASRELFGKGEPSKLDTMVPKSNQDFDNYVQLLMSTYILPHKQAKQWKYFIKTLVKQACEPFNKDELKDIEAAVASVRSDKVKADIAAAKEQRKGAKKNIRIESDDISAAMDYRSTGVNGDDDYDFM